MKKSLAFIRKKIVSFKWKEIISLEKLISLKEKISYTYSKKTYIFQMKKISYIYPEEKWFLQIKKALKYLFEKKNEFLSNENKFVILV